MTSYMAKKMAERQAESLLAPLLSDDESSYSGKSAGSGGDDSDSDSDASSKVETVKRSPLEKLKSLVVFAGLGGGVALSAASMVFFPIVPIFVMGAVCVANVPYAAFKERAMGKIPSLRAMNNKLREEANNLSREVDFLSGEVDILEPEAERAAEVEEQLRDIATQQQANVDKFVELVKENEIIVAKQRENLRQMIMTDMITLVMKSDSDKSMTIDRTEAKMLALRIRLALQEYNVVFDSQKFIRVVGAIGSEASVYKVIEIVQKLMPSEKQKEGAGDDKDETDHTLYESSDEEEWDDEDDDFDMFHMATDGPLARSSSMGSGRRGSIGYGTTSDGAVGVSLMKSDKRRPSLVGKASRGVSRRRLEAGL